MDANAAISYRAQPLIGGLDRLVLSKRDTAAGVCAVIRLVHPDLDGGFGLDVPADWDTEFAYVHRDLATCHDLAGPPTEAVYAESGTGTIAWLAGQLYPAEIATVDVMLAFPPGAPWVPASSTWQVDDLVVQ